MKSFAALIVTVAALLPCSLANIVPFERLNKNDSMLLVLDLQDGLYSLARDLNPTLYYNAMLAHAAIGQLFDVPVVLSTSAQIGSNGSLPEAILDMYSDAPLIQQQGEVDAWIDAEYCAAIKATGKLQTILVGVTTDVYMLLRTLEKVRGHTDMFTGTTFCALSLRAEGHSVWVNVEASGTTTEFILDVFNDRMAAAGVQLVSLFSIVCDLMRDLKNTPGARTVIPWLAKYHPIYGILAQAHGDAVQHETIQPGEAALIS